MQWLNWSRSPASPFLILTYLFSLVRSVDIALSVSYSPFARSITQICTQIRPGACCEGIGPSHRAFYWAGLQVSNLPDTAEANAFHAASQNPYVPYWGGCSGPIIGHGFGPGTWIWGGFEGVPRAWQPLSGGMWYDSPTIARRLRVARVWHLNSSSSPPPLDQQSQEMPAQVARRAQPDETPVPSALPDVIVVDGMKYTDAQRKGLYRDENGTSYTGQQLMEAAFTNSALQ